uniref:Bug family tripartite tricarboxylate transporter substrate binding protein n=1 Tax=Hylemonella sp. TaxID=2066020 RepID=UPI0035AFC9D1
MYTILNRRAVLAATAAMLTVGSALAQSFPNKTVSLVVPYPAGGVSDVIARSLNTVLAKQLGQPVIVENIAGASGGIAAQKVLQAPGDGHLIFQGGPNELILAPLANSAIKYRSEDFRLVQMIAVNPLAMFARNGLPVSNGDELAAYARKAAAEGKPLTFASVGAGSLYHVLGEQLSKVVGAPMTHVPYKGIAPAQQDVMAGLVDIFISPYGKSQVQMVEQGRMKVVVTLSAERQEMLKTYPSVTESKALKDFVFSTWSGYFVRKDTPEAVVQALHKALGEVANDAGVRAALEAQAITVPRPQALPALDRLYAEGIARYRGIASGINLQAQ